MKPISFPSQNVIIAENQEGVEPLPAHYDKANGIVTTIWELDSVEIESVRETGKIMLEVYTFGNPLQPVNILTLHENQRRNGAGQ
jgi:hypothetical protein